MVYNVGELPYNKPCLSAYIRSTSDAASDDALNLAACQYARAHQDEFPLDTRPLRRSRLASA